MLAANLVECVGHDVGPDQGSGGEDEDNGVWHPKRFSRYHSAAVDFVGHDHVGSPLCGQGPHARSPSPRRSIGEYLTNGVLFAGHVHFPQRQPGGRRFGRRGADSEGFEPGRLDDVDPPGTARHSHDMPGVLHGAGDGH